MAPLAYIRRIIAAVFNINGISFVKTALNSIYRVVWSDVLNAWIVVSEIASSHRKRSSCSRTAARSAEAGGARQSAYFRHRLRLLSLALFGAFAVPGFATTITADGRTATQVRVVGNTTSITTNTVAGTTGFNSFSNFSLDQGSTANLYVPQGASTLINIVRNSQAVINGAVNAYKDGRIGGNIFFVDPYGVVVGAAGTLNVGRLTLATPSAAFLDQLVSPAGLVDSASLTRLMSNDIPVSPDGLIRVHGRVNAPDGVALIGQEVSVSGLLNTGPAAAAQIALFESAVNTSGVTSGTQLVVTSGGIEIVAQSAVELSGTLVADGAAGQNAGSISVTTVQGDIAVGNSALLSARGVGDNSSGGSIRLLAAANMQLGAAPVSTFSGAQSGPVFEASAESAGSGGTIETSARGTVHLYGGTFNATAHSGTNGYWLLDPTDLVIDSNSAIVSHGTDLTFTADNSITLLAGVKIDTTKLDAGGLSTASSGAVSMTAPNITVNGTIDTHATGAFAAGAVTLSASSGSASTAITIAQGAVIDATAATAQLAGAVSLTADNTNSQFVIAGGMAEATSSIDLSGSISGGELKFLATASAISSWKSSATNVAQSIAGDAASSVLGVGAGVVSGNAAASVKVHSGAVLNASGNVVLNATTIATADDSIITLSALNATGTSSYAVPTAVYGQVKGISAAQIESGANVTAHGLLTVKAQNTAHLNVSSISTTQDTPVSLTVAYGTADVESTASIASGATITANAVHVVAHNDNQFSVNATAFALGSGQVGAVLAIADGLKSTATALEGSSLSLANGAGQTGLIVEADSLTTKDSVSASTAVGTSMLLRGLANATLAPLAAKSQGKGNSQLQALSFGKAASALALTLDDNQSATAQVAADSGASIAPVIDAPSVAVIAQVLDSGVRNSGQSAVNSPNVSTATPNNPAATSSVSAGVAVAIRNLNADAEIGSGVTVNAPYIGVHASTTMPLTLTWLTWNSPSAVLSHLNGTLGLCSDIATSCVNAAGDASTVGLAGSAAYMSVNASATAWVGHGAILHSSVLNSAAPGWSALLDTGDALTFAAPVSVKALGELDAIAIGGNFSITVNGTGGASNSATVVGGAVNYMDFRNTTTAGIDAGVSVDTGGILAVSANTSDGIVSVTPSSGRGGARDGAGDLSLTTIFDVTHASISNQAHVRAAAVAVTGGEVLNIVTAAGAFEMANSAAVGMGAAINDIHTDTQAYIGNNAADVPSTAAAQWVPNTPVTPPAPGVVTAALDVAAQTTGQLLAIGAAGTLAKSSDSDPNAAPPDSTTADANRSATLWQRITGAGSNPAANLPATPEFGVGVSGSVAGNLVTLGTQARVEGVGFNTPLVVTYDATLAAPGGAASASDYVKLAAIRDTAITAGAGAVALTMANSSSSQSSSAISGSYAFEISNNQTTAKIDSAKLVGYSDVEVHALASGAQFNFGIDFSLNVSNSGKSSTAAAGSVSTALINDGVAASVTDSTIEGDAHASAARTLSVEAYDNTDIAIGGGSLYVSGRGGSSEGGGGSVALSYLQIADPNNGLATDAHITGSAVSNFDQVSVLADNSARVLIGAATGGSSGGANGFSGAVVYDNLSRTTQATINGDTHAASSFSPTGAIDVTATGVDQSSLDTQIAGVGAAVTAPIAFDMAASAVGLHQGPGAAVIAVAGFLQQGKSNLGISMLDNNVADTMRAQISGTTVTTDVGTVSVKATNGAMIYAAGAGVGIADGALAGVGSLVTNSIADTTEARIESGTSGATIFADQVDVFASDSSSIYALAGNIAVNTSKNAVGAALAINRIGVFAGISVGGAAAPSSTNAHISGAATVVTARNVSVHAQSTASIDTIAVAGAAAQNNAIAGSLATNLMAPVVSASIEGGATVTGRDNVAVLASNSDSIRVIAGAVAIGASANGIGVSSAVNEISGETSAYISGTSVVNAEGQSQATQAVNSGQLATPLNLAASLTPGSAPDLAESTINVSGLAVVATSLQVINAVAVSVGGGASNAAAVVPVINLMGGTTRAFIGDGVQVDTELSSSVSPDAQIGSQPGTQAIVRGSLPSIEVGASSHTYAGTMAIGAAASGGNSGSAALVVNTMDRLTDAYIGVATIGGLNSSGYPDVLSVDVGAKSSQTAATIAVGFSAGLSNGLAGTGVVNFFNAETDAHLNGGSLTSGSLTVSADNINGINAELGTGAVGATAAIAASFALSSSTDSTNAYIGTAPASLLIPHPVASPALLQLSGDLLVTANTENNNYSIVVSGAGGGAAGVAGMADVTLLSNSTYAGLNNVSANGSNLGRMGNATVTATESVSVNSYAGALGVGGTAGVGAGANVVILQNAVAAEIGASRLNSAGSVQVTATSDRTVDAVTATAAAGGTGGIGLGASVVLLGNGETAGAASELNSNGGGTLQSVSQLGSGGSSLSGNATLSTSEQGPLSGQGTSSVAGVLGGVRSDAASATVDAGSTITASSLTVSASATVGTSNIVGSVGIGGAVGVGGAVGYTRVDDDVSAASFATVTAPSVSVSASMSDHSGQSAATVDAYAGAASAVVGLGAAVADAAVNNQVTATLGGTLTGDHHNAGNVTVTASDSSSVHAVGVGAAAGSVAAGVVLGWAEKNSNVEARLQAADIGAAQKDPVSGVISAIDSYQQMTVSASDSGSVKGSAMAAAGGVAAGSGADGRATDRSYITAQASGAINLGSLGLSVDASAAPDTSAFGLGVSVGALAAGVSLATADSAPTVRAQIADATQLLGAGELKVRAHTDLPDSGNSAYANALAASGSLFLGLDGTIASAQSNASVEATVGNAVLLPDGNVAITAINNSNEFATTTGVAIGYIAVGLNTSNAQASATTLARLGSGAVTKEYRGGDLQVRASGQDTTVANAFAGSGGLVAGDAAIATTRNESTTTAELLSTPPLSTFYTGGVLIYANHQATYGGSVDSLNAAILGASGAILDNTVRATTTALIGDNVKLDAAGQIIATAESGFTETGAGVSGAGGGVLNGAAASSSTTVNGITATSIGKNVSLRSGIDPNADLGGIKFTASSTFDGADSATLSTGGAITAAWVSSSVNATLNNLVSLDSADTLFTYGNIGIGTWVTGTSSSTGLASTYGAIPVAHSSSDITLNSTQQVSLATGDSLTAVGDVNLTAGQEPFGLFNTSLLLKSVAEAYVRGLVALPTAVASDSITNNSSLTIARGANIGAGQNVTLASVQGDMQAQADGNSHGYWLGFIPASGGDSRSSTGGSASLTIDGSITAGIYSTQNLTISDCQNSGIFCSTVTQGPGGLPVNFSWQSDFDPMKMVAAGSVLAGGVSSTAVGALSLGGLFASGGTVTINTETLQGTGTVTSNGSPTITVNNYSPDYLIVGGATIPDIPGGKIIFSGAAGTASAQAAGIALHTNGGSAAPVITINQAYNQAVGTTSNGEGPGLFLTGDFTNFGGAISIRNTLGSVGQNAGLFAQQLNVYAPSGAYEVNTDIYQAGSSPAALWQNYMIWPGGNPALGVPDPYVGVEYVANAMFNSSGSITDPNAFTRSLIGAAGQTSNLVSINRYAVGPGSLLFYGATSCALYGCGGFYNYGAAAALSPTGRALTLTSNIFYSMYLPVVGTINKLNDSVATYTANAQYSSAIRSAQVYGSQVSIRANLIDINAPINVGSPTDWSFNAGSNVGQTLAQDRVLYNLGLLTQRNIDITNMVAKPGSSPISASYDLQTNQITLGKVNAVSGGAKLTMDGNIVSTTTLGNIRVNSGLGDININNQTGIPIVVNNLNAGSQALASQLGGSVEIIDRLENSQSNHWLYSYVQGGGMTVQNGAATTPAASMPVVLTDATANSEIFNPQAGSRWLWTEQANLIRTADSNGNLSNWVWNFPSGSPNNPWQFVNAPGAPSASPIGVVSINSRLNLPVFETAVTGSIYSYTTRGIAYQGCDSSTCHYGFSNTGQGTGDWYYVFPTNLTLTQTSSVKADNPVSISFTGRTTGNVAIQSNASVTINGQITNASGPTSITTTLGSISQSNGAGIASGNLTLSAADAIGSAAVPIQATLSAGALLNASSTRGDINLAIDSAAIVGNVTASGDVAISASGGLLAQSAASLISGRDLSLTAALGGVGTLAQPMPLMTAATGVVNVSAQGDIALQKSAGDMLVGSVKSTAGDISINVTNGALLSASGQTAAQTLSQDQLTQYWQSLHLTGADAIGNAISHSVTPLRALVAADYQRYTGLMQSGSLASDGSYVLNSASLHLFSAQAAASLGVSAPTSAQVQSYANTLYQKLFATLTNYLGANWTGLSDLASKATNYALPTDMSNAITAEAVWSQSDLLYAIDQKAMQPSAGIVGNATPSISGRAVRLQASNIGKLAPAVTISKQDLIAGTLTPTQQAALVAAMAPGDVIARDANGNSVAITDPTLTTFELPQIAPLFVASSGNFSARSQAAAYIQSTLADLNLASLTAGGSVYVAAPRSIFNAASNGVAINTTGDLTLVSGSGDIGSAAAPMSFQLNGGRLAAASAGQSAWLTTPVGDMTIGWVFALGSATLSAPNGSIASYLPGVSIDAGNINLAAANNWGRSLAPLDMNVGASGALTGTAGGSAWVGSMADLTLGNLRAGGSLALTVAGALIESDNSVVRSYGGGLTANASALTVGAASLLQATGGNLNLNVNGAINEGTGSTIGSSTAGVTFNAASLTMGSNSSLQAAGGNVNLALTGAISQGANSSVTNTAGGVIVSAASLAMDASSAMQATHAINLSTQTGDMVLGTLESTQGNGQALVLHSAGAINGNGDGHTNLTANQTGAQTLLIAANDIGSAAQPLLSNVPQADASSLHGSIWLHNQTALSSNTIAAAAAVNLTIDAALQFGTIQAGTDVIVSSGGNMNGNSLLAPSGRVALDAAGTLTVQQIVASNASLSSASNLQVSQIQVASELDIAAPVMQVTVQQTQAGASAPLKMNATGYHGAIAQSLAAIVTPVAALEMPVLFANNATLQVNAPVASIQDGRMTGVLQLNTTALALYQNNGNTAPHAADVQTYQQRGPFSLALNGKKLVSSSYVLSYAPDVAVTVLNYDSSHHIAPQVVTAVSVIGDVAASQRASAEPMPTLTPPLPPGMNEAQRSVVVVGLAGGVNVERIESPSANGIELVPEPANGSSESQPRQDGV